MSPKRHLQQYNRWLRYALVMSIHTPQIGVGIYAPIETQIRTLVPILRV